MRIQRHLAGLFAALLLLAAGCGGGGVAGPRKALDPGGTLLALLEAAEAGDDARTETFVTLASKPGLDVTRLTALAHLLVGARIVLSEPVEGPWAVAAVVKGMRVFAVPLRRERGAWRVELGDPIRLRPVLPHPGRIALSSNPQIAAEARASGDELGVALALWVDGVAFPIDAGGPRPGYVTAFGRLGHDLAPGLHVVIAFARAGTGAVATAWTFRAPGPVA